jgi:CRP/FNR family transcriptional regulator, cyclic AMP receptor protein
MSLPPDDKVIEIVNVAQGTVLFRQGDAGEAAYVVNDGLVGIYRENGASRVPLATIRRGELFGEMAVIDGSPRMATAFAITECTLTVISAAQIGDKMRRTDPFVKALVQMLMHNLRSVHNSYAPKPRSLADVVTNLSRQEDALNGFLASQRTAEARADLEPAAKSLSMLVQHLREMVTKHRDEDRRADAMPPQLPSA